MAYGEYQFILFPSGNNPNLSEDGFELLVRTYLNLVKLYVYLKN